MLARFPLCWPRKTSNLHQSSPFTTFPLNDDNVDCKVNPRVGDLQIPSMALDSGVSFRSTGTRAERPFVIGGISRGECLFVK